MHWTLKEEEALLVCMLEEFKDDVKWKAKNDVKSGFFRAVEILLHKMLPRTTIRATPYIESKIKNWKEKYGLVANMQRLSGISWNHEINSVVVDSPNVWDEYVKFHSKANGMNGKAFPMFPQCQILFGKHKAPSEMTEDPAEIRNDGSKEEIEQPIQSFVGTNDFYTPQFVNGDFVFGGGSFINLSAGGSQGANPTALASNANATTPNAFIANPPAKKVKKMSKAEEKQAALNDAFRSYMAESKEVMVKLVDVVGFEQRL
ncbi:hypothetical protein Vadar_020973 [Vaccinium darrowii]|uniref:Uncharacterized protein n=1 Tax=Vaccinium darrowii TaxID=229202 RepID=A0ACB7Y215_9ERIC|nr:hypothetical protein Vadar_020973 [Vaccinium darrowii]